MVVRQVVSYRCRVQVVLGGLQWLTRKNCDCGCRAIGVGPAVDWRGCWGEKRARGRIVGGEGREDLMQSSAYSTCPFAQRALSHIGL